MDVPKDEIIKAAIIEAAKKLFQQYGLAKTTMEDIAKAVGKGKSSLYYYYATKEDIFEAVMIKDKACIIEETKAAIDKAGTAEEKLRTFALTIHKAVRKRVILFNILSSEMKENMCIMKSVRQKYDAIELELLRSIIVYGIETGEFTAYDKEELDDVAFVGTSTFRGLQIHLIHENHRSASGIKHLINTAVDMLVKALKKETK
ncbi:TetR/AcrR family transcriptional regulator [Chitinophagaceae bacterium MMS25-I14]